MSLVMHSSNDVRWFTPWHILEAARQALGGPITLDPASEPAANLNVQASMFFTDRGQDVPWKAARLFVNPPYDRHGTQWAFARKLAEREATEAVGLFRASVGAHGFDPLWSADVMCFLRGRLRFEGGADGPAPFDSVLVYFGPHAQRASDAFRPLGVIR